MKSMSFLISSMFLIQFISGIPTAASPGNRLYQHHGDVTLDGWISADDARLAFLIALGVYTPTQEEYDSADCNGDGMVTPADANLILLTGLHFPDFYCMDSPPDPPAEPTPTPAVPDDIVRVDEINGNSGDIVTAHLLLSNSSAAVDSFMVDLLYDPDMLQYSGHHMGDLDPGWQMSDTVEVQPGHLRMGAFVFGSEIPAGSSGSLVDISFLITCSDCYYLQTCLLELQRNLDDIRSCFIEDGVFTFSGNVCMQTGDVNFSGDLTAEDASLAFQIALGYWMPGFLEECAADCNGDIYVTAGDAQSIFLAVLGIGTCTDPILPPLYHIES